jgi:hypothetical protein
MAVRVYTYCSDWWDAETCGIICEAISSAEKLLENYYKSD